MASLRSEIWCAAFVRKHNDKGNICVLSRKGDKSAGQIWIEVDHLNGTSSLFSQVSRAHYSLSGQHEEDDGTLRFQCRIMRKPYDEAKQRLQREAEFDPDFWLLTLESPDSDHGLELAKED